MNTIINTYHGVWFNDIEFIKNSREDIENLYNLIFENNNSFHWLIYKDNIPVGIICADREQQEINAIELSYNVHPDYWRMGIAQTAVELVIEYLFNNYEYENIKVAYCTGNEKSRRLIEKLGFEEYEVNKNAYERYNKKVDEYVYILSKK